MKQQATSAKERAMWTLQWRHNECDGVSNHQHIDCLLNGLFRRRSKTSKLRITGFSRGNHRWPVNSPHKCSKASAISEMMPYMQNPINLKKFAISYLQLCLNKLFPSLRVCNLTVAIFKFMSRKCILYNGVLSFAGITNNLLLFFLSNATFSFKNAFDYVVANRNHLIQAPCAYWRSVGFWWHSISHHVAIHGYNPDYNVRFIFSYVHLAITIDEYLSMTTWHCAKWPTRSSREITRHAVCP